MIGLFIHARMSALSALVSERINADRLKRELLSREAEEFAFLNSYDAARVPASDAVDG